MTNLKVIRLRFWPLSSFLGLLDLKTGVTVALLFALLNKVAGVYGLIAALTGAGGSFAQLSLYVYSAVALIALAWGLRAVKEEDPKQTLYFAHLYFADHIFSTSWTVFFALGWWVYKPHDGKLHVNSPAQEHLYDVYIGNHTTYTDEQRAQAAADIWNQEKSMAASVIILSWLTKIYFALLLYSYAIHLRQGSYRLLPHSRPSNDPQSAAADGWEEEVEEEIPLQNPFSGDTNNYRTPGENIVFDEADPVEAGRAHS
ncbi:DUF1753-domain-containing protein [Pterulicium gracile]|uniref:DUF1753-domain-containing protein n=1 Tax=Pterulicium gracile TaxID=1884261 RepID=A0A5C3QNN2_9AGAR|nr:DUF1753-domain-containing protein [Pterula gracilis]